MSTTHQLVSDASKCRLHPLSLAWVDWFNNRRLLAPLGYMPPAEFESMYYSRKSIPTMQVGLTQSSLR